MGTAQTARADECALLPRAVELLEAAYDRGELSLGTLCQVHALLVDAPAGIGGRLRNVPAVVRLEGLMTFVPPPAAAARSGAEMFAAALTEQLSTASQDVPPPVLAAQASARFTDLHPFADGNGRVARAIATWLLVRARHQHGALHVVIAALSARRAGPAPSRIKSVGRELWLQNVGLWH